MLTFYCLRACNKCDEFNDPVNGFVAGTRLAEHIGRPWRIVALDTSEKLQDYARRVKPTLPMGISLPLWYDESARTLWKTSGKLVEKTKREKSGANKRAE